MIKALCVHPAVEHNNTAQIPKSYIRCLPELVPGVATFQSERKEPALQFRDPINSSTARNLAQQ